MVKYSLNIMKIDFASRRDSKTNRIKAKNIRSSMKNRKIER